METILDTIGKTHLVKLQNILNNKKSTQVLLKLEGSNPGGSIKDRPALYIIQEAERNGLLRPGGTIIESSSGNFGISLAMIGAARGYQVIILVDPKTTQANLSTLNALGAKVIVVTDKDDSGSYHKTRIALANKLHSEIPNSFRPDQCFNKLNSTAHYYSTARELFVQSEGELDTIVVSMSTGGQIGGISKFFSEHSPRTKIIAVDAEGSTIFGKVARPYLLPGMGLSWTPANIEKVELIHSVFKVQDRDAFLACRVLARREGILAGGSTGASIFVALKLALDNMDPRKKIAIIASDNGDRYLNSIYNSQWLTENGVWIDPNLENLFSRINLLTPFSLNPAKDVNYIPNLLFQLGGENNSSHFENQMPSLRARA